jgi:hypothetical protein
LLGLLVLTNLIVQVAVHIFGIRLVGLCIYLAHYLAPNSIVQPFHLISEVTRTLSLVNRNAPPGGWADPTQLGSAGVATGSSIQTTVAR